MNSFSRWDTIIVSERQLIVGNYCWTTDIPEVLKDMMPVDIMGDIKSGCFAYLIRWDMLPLNQVVKFVADSWDFVNGIVLLDLGINVDEQAGVYYKMFDKMPRLKTLVIADKVITRPLSDDVIKWHEYNDTIKGTFLRWRDKDREKGTSHYWHYWKDDIADYYHRDKSQRTALGWVGRLFVGGLTGALNLTHKAFRGTAKGLAMGNKGLMDMVKDAWK